VDKTVIFQFLRNPLFLLRQVASETRQNTPPLFSSAIVSASMILPDHERIVSRIIRLLDSAREDEISGSPLRIVSLKYHLPCI